MSKQSKRRPGSPPLAEAGGEIAPTDQHSVLVGLGARHAQREGFPIVATELRAWGSREEADVIAFRVNTSLLIEAKCSRADFLADSRKPERTAGGLGVYRFYICPAGLIQVSDLPKGWGLLWVEQGKVVPVLRPQGNLWPSYDPNYPHGTWSEFMHEPDWRAERAVMFSIARRRSLTRSEERYEEQVREATRRGDRLARACNALEADNRELSMRLYSAEQRVQAMPPSELVAAIPRARKKRA